MLGYQVQFVTDVLGTASAPVTLTGAYTTDNTNDAYISVGRLVQGVLYVGYTMGSGESGNSLQVEVAYSPDVDADETSIWFKETTESISSGTRTLSIAEFTFAATGAAGTYDYIRIPIPVCEKRMRIRIKETGLVTNGGQVFIKFIGGGI